MSWFSSQPTHTTPSSTTPATSSYAGPCDASRTHSMSSLPDQRGTTSVSSSFPLGSFTTHGESTTTMKTTEEGNRVPRGLPSPSRYPPRAPQEGPPYPTSSTTTTTTMDGALERTGASSTERSHDKMSDRSPHSLPYEWKEHRSDPPTRSSMTSPILSTMHYDPNPASSSFPLRASTKKGVDQNVQRETASSSSGGLPSRKPRKDCHDPWTQIGEAKMTSTSTTSSISSSSSSRKGFPSTNTTPPPHDPTVPPRWKGSPERRTEITSSVSSSSCARRALPRWMSSSTASSSREDSPVVSSGTTPPSPVLPGERGWEGMSSTGSPLTRSASGVTLVKAPSTTTAAHPPPPPPRAREERSLPREEAESSRTAGRDLVQVKSQEVSSSHLSTRDVDPSFPTKPHEAKPSEGAYPYQRRSARRSAGPAHSLHCASVEEEEGGEEGREGNRPEVELHPPRRPRSSKRSERHHVKEEEEEEEGTPRAPERLPSAPHLGAHQLSTAIPSSSLSLSLPFSPSHQETVLPSPLSSPPVLFYGTTSLPSSSSLTSSFYTTPSIGVDEMGRGRPEGLPPTPREGGGGPLRIPLPPNYVREVKPPTEDDDVVSFDTPQRPGREGKEEEEKKTPQKRNTKEERDDEGEEEEGKEALRRSRHCTSRSSSRFSNEKQSVGRKKPFSSRHTTRIHSTSDSSSSPSALSSSTSSTTESHPATNRRRFHRTQQQQQKRRSTHRRRSSTRSSSSSSSSSSSHHRRRSGNYHIPHPHPHSSHPRRRRSGRAGGTQPVHTAPYTVPPCPPSWKEKSTQKKRHSPVSPSPSSSSSSARSYHISVPAAGMSLLPPSSSMSWDSSFASPSSSSSVVPRSVDGSTVHADSSHTRRKTPQHVAPSFTSMHTPGSIWIDATAAGPAAPVADPTTTTTNRTHQNDGKGEAMPKKEVHGPEKKKGEKKKRLSTSPHPYCIQAEGTDMGCTGEGVTGGRARSSERTTLASCSRALPHPLVDLTGVSHPLGESTNLEGGPSHTMPSGTRTMTPHTSPEHTLTSLEAVVSLQQAPPTLATVPLSSSLTPLAMGGAPASGSLPSSSPLLLPLPPSGVYSPFSTPRSYSFSSLWPLSEMDRIRSPWWTSGAGQPSPFSDWSTTSTGGATAPSPPPSVLEPFSQDASAYPLPPPPTLPPSLTWFTLHAPPPLPPAAMPSLSGVPARIVDPHGPPFRNTSREVPPSPMWVEEEGAAARTQKECEQKRWSGYLRDAEFLKAREKDVQRLVLNRWSSRLFLRLLSQRVGQMDRILNEKDQPTRSEDKKKKKGEAALEKKKKNTRRSPFAGRKRKTLPQESTLRMEIPSNQPETPNEHSLPPDLDGEKTGVEGEASTGVLQSLAHILQCYQRVTGPTRKMLLTENTEQDTKGEVASDLESRTVVASHNMGCTSLVYYDPSHLYEPVKPAETSSPPSSSVSREPLPSTGEAHRPAEEVAQPSLAPTQRTSSSAPSCHPSSTLHEALLSNSSYSSSFTSISSDTAASSSSSSSSSCWKKEVEKETKGNNGVSSPLVFSNSHDSLHQDQQGQHTPTTAPMTPMTPMTSTYPTREGSKLSSSVSTPDKWPQESKRTRAEERADPVLVTMTTTSPSPPPSLPRAPSSWTTPGMHAGTRGTNKTRSEPVPSREGIKVVKEEEENEGIELASRRMQDRPSMRGDIKTMRGRYTLGSGYSTLGGGIIRWVSHTKVPKQPSTTAMKRSPLVEATRVRRGRRGQNAKGEKRQQRRIVPMWYPFYSDTSSSSASSSSSPGSTSTEDSSHRRPRLVHRYARLRHLRYGRPLWRALRFPQSRHWHRIGEKRWRAGRRSGPLISDSTGNLPDTPSLCSSWVSPSSLAMGGGEPWDAPNPRGDRGRGRKGKKTVGRESSHDPPSFDPYPMLFPKTFQHFQLLRHLTKTEAKELGVLGKLFHRLQASTRAPPHDAVRGPSTVMATPVTVVPLRIPAPPSLSTSSSSSSSSLVDGSASSASFSRPSNESLDLFSDKKEASPVEEDASGHGEDPTCTPSVGEPFFSSPSLDTKEAEKTSLTCPTTITADGSVPLPSLLLVSQDPPPPPPPLFQDSEKKKEGISIGTMTTTETGVQCNGLPCDVTLQTSTTSIESKPAHPSEEKITTGLPEPLPLPPSTMTTSSASCSSSSGQRISFLPLPPPPPSLATISHSVVQLYTKEEERKKIKEENERRSDLTSTSSPTSPHLVSVLSSLRSGVVVASPCSSSSSSSSSSAPFSSTSGASSGSSVLDPPPLPLSPFSSTPPPPPSSFTIGTASPSSTPTRPLTIHVTASSTLRRAVEETLRSADTPLPGPARDAYAVMSSLSHEPFGSPTMEDPKEKQSQKETSRRDDSPHKYDLSYVLKKKHRRPIGSSSSSSLSSSSSVSTSPVERHQESPDGPPETRKHHPSPSTTNAMADEEVEEEGVDLRSNYDALREAAIRELEAILALEADQEREEKEEEERNERQHRKAEKRKRHAERRERQRSRRRKRKEQKKQKKREKEKKRQQDEDEKNIPKGGKEGDKHAPHRHHGHHRRSHSREHPPHSKREESSGREGAARSQRQRSARESQEQDVRSSCFSSSCSSGTPTRSSSSSSSSPKEKWNEKDKESVASFSSRTTPHPERAKTRHRKGKPFSHQKEEEFHPITTNTTSEEKEVHVRLLVPGRYYYFHPSKGQLQHIPDPLEAVAHGKLPLSMDGSSLRDPLYYVPHEEWKRLKEEEEYRTRRSKRPHCRMAPSRPASGEEMKRIAHHHNSGLDTEQAAWRDPLLSKHSHDEEEEEDEDEDDTMQVASTSYHPLTGSSSCSSTSSPTSPHHTCPSWQVRPGSTTGAILSTVDGRYASRDAERDGRGRAEPSCRSTDATPREVVVVGGRAGCPRLNPFCHACRERFHLVLVDRHHRPIPLFEGSILATATRGSRRAPIPLSASSLPEEERRMEAPQKSSRTRVPAMEPTTTTVATFPTAAHDAGSPSAASLPMCSHPRRHGPFRERSSMAMRPSRARGERSGVVGYAQYTYSALCHHGDVKVVSSPSLCSGTSLVPPTPEAVARSSFPPPCLSGSTSKRALFPPSSCVERHRRLPLPLPSSSPSRVLAKPSRPPLLERRGPYTVDPISPSPLVCGRSTRLGVPRRGSRPPAVVVACRHDGPFVLAEGHAALPTSTPHPTTTTQDVLHESFPPCSLPHGHPMTHPIQPESESRRTRIIATTAPKRVSMSYPLPPSLHGARGGTRTREGAMACSRPPFPPRTVDTIQDDLEERRPHTRSTTERNAPEEEKERVIPRRQQMLAPHPPLRPTAGAPTASSSVSSSSSTSFMGVLLPQKPTPTTSTRIRLHQKRRAVLKEISSLQDSLAELSFMMERKKQQEEGRREEDAKVVPHHAMREEEKGVRKHHPSHRDILQHFYPSREGEKGDRRKPKEQEEETRNHSETPGKKYHTRMETKESSFPNPVWKQKATAPSFSIPAPNVKEGSPVELRQGGTPLSSLSSGELHASHPPTRPPVPPPPTHKNLHHHHHHHVAVAAAQLPSQSSLDRYPEETTLSSSLRRDPSELQPVLPSTSHKRPSRRMKAKESSGYVNEVEVEKEAEQRAREERRIGNTRRSEIGRRTSHPNRGGRTALFSGDTTPMPYAVPLEGTFVPLSH